MMPPSVESIIETEGTQLRLEALVPWRQGVQTDLAPFVDVTVQNKEVFYSVTSVATEIGSGTLKRTFKLKKVGGALKAPQFSFAGQRLSTSFYKLVAGQWDLVGELPDLLFELNLREQVVVKGINLVPDTVLYLFRTDNRGIIVSFAELLVQRGI